MEKQHLNAFFTPSHPFCTVSRRSPLSATTLNFQEDALVPLDHLSPSTMAILFSPSPKKKKKLQPYQVLGLRIRLWKAHGKVPRAIQVALLVQPSTALCYNHGIRQFVWMVLKQEGSMYYLHHRQYQRLGSGQCMLCDKTGICVDDNVLERSYTLYRNKDIPYTFRQQQGRMYVDFQMPPIDELREPQSWTHPLVAEQVKNWNNIL